MKTVIKYTVIALVVGFLVFCAGILILLIIGNNTGKEIQAALWLTTIPLIIWFARYCKLHSIGPFRAIGHIALSGIAFTAKILNLSTDEPEVKDENSGIGWHQNNGEWHIGVDDPFVLHDEE